METSYKEKYEQALERAKMEMSKDGMKNDVIAIHLAETIFPELKESEDERIRKEITDFLKLPHPQFVGKRDHEKWIAWLKKQESVDEIVSRCKNSWYNEGKIAGMAEGLTNDEKYQQGWHDALEKLGEQEKDILEDAILDGNEDGLIAETIKYKNEKQGEKKPADSYCQENCKGFQETGKCFADGECKAKREAEQKSITWNEEDETNLTNTIIMLKEGASHHFLNSSIVPCVNWLISLKDRVGCEANCTTTKEWSEEDEQHIDSLLKRLDSLCRNKFERTRFAISEDRDWLKFLRPQNNITDEELAQAKKNAYNDALDKIEYHSGEPTFDDGWSAAIDYIRKKSLRPQNRWKPSEDDIIILEKLIKGELEPKVFQATLQGILEQLKKLKEGKV